jgi:hypothetical protein
VQGRLYTYIGSRTMHVGRTCGIWHKDWLRRAGLTCTGFADNLNGRTFHNLAMYMPWKTIISAELLIVVPEGRARKLLT